MKLKRFILTFAALALAAFFALDACAPLSALTREEAIQQKAQLQQQLIDINRRLAEIKDDVEKAQEKARTYAERKSIVEEQIRIIKEAIDLKEQELAARQEELELKIKETADTYALFKQRMRALYMNNNYSSALEMLLGASDFTEFVMNSEASRRISEHDTQLIAKLEREQKEIEEIKAGIESDLAQLDLDKQELDAKYNELALLYQEANNELSTAEALQSATQDDYDKILAELSAMEAQWDALMGTGMADYVGDYFAWPVPGHPGIYSPFGWRTLYGRPNFHGGIDISYPDGNGVSIKGKPIIASDTGRVRTAAYNAGGYGNYVIIDHGGDVWTVYGHMAQYIVYEGEWVSQGQTIGYVGTTGNSTGYHLHFEIRINGQRVNPADYVVM